MKKSEKSEKKEEKVALVLLDIVSDTRTSTAVQGVRALGQVHTSLSPEPNMDLWRTGKAERVRPPKTRFNFQLLRGFWIFALKVSGKRPEKKLYCGIFVGEGTLVGIHSRF